MKKFMDYINQGDRLFWLFFALAWCVIIAGTIFS